MREVVNIGRDRFRGGPFDFRGVSWVIGCFQLGCYRLKWPYFPSKIPSKIFYYDGKSRRKCELNSLRSIELASQIDFSTSFTCPKIFYLNHGHFDDVKVVKRSQCKLPGSKETENFWPSETGKSTFPRRVLIFFSDVKLQISWTEGDSIHFTHKRNGLQKYQLS